MRKIRSDEIRLAAGIMTDCFCDYPLYKSFFPDDSKRRRQLFYFCWYYIFVRRSFTYISPDCTSLISVQKPGDRFCSPLPLLLTTPFLPGAVFTLPLRALLMLPSYAKLSHHEAGRFLNRDADWFIHIMCVRGNNKGGGFFNVIRDMDIGEPLYCYTHTERNVRLYRHIGFEILNKTLWHGVPVYTMHRKRKDRACGSFI